MLKYSTEIIFAYISMETRLNKALSLLGITSRRNADELIKNGMISINGNIEITIGSKIKSSDVITFNEQNYSLAELSTEPNVWLYYKKVGLVTTHSDPQHRPTVFEEIKKYIKRRVISIGRLDINSEGLLLLTDSNSFAHLAESPRTNWKRKYRVRVFGALTPEAINEIEKGIAINSINYAPIIIKTMPALRNGRNNWYELILSEGKNREIRKIFEHFNLQVNRLIRVAYGPYQLGDLRPGEIQKCIRIIFPNI